MTHRIRVGQFVISCAAALYAIALISLQQVRDPQAAWLRATKAAILAVAWLAVTGTALAVISARPGTGLRPLRTVDLVLEFAWLASTAATALLGAVLLWRALASAELTDAIVRATRSTAAVAVTAMTAGLVATGTEAGLLRTYAPALIGTGWLAVVGAGTLAATIMTGLALPQMRETIRSR